MGIATRFKPPNYIMYLVIHCNGIEQEDEFIVPKVCRKPKMFTEAENDLQKYFIIRQECGFGLTESSCL
jgi:hypothetical protein